MKSLRLRILAAALAGATLLAAAPALFAADELKNIPLKWALKEKDEAMPPLDLGSNAGKTFSIKPFKDKRSNPGLIGENREKEVKQVTTSDNVGAFAALGVRRMMTAAGMKFVEGNSDFVIEGEVTEFFCLETNLYKARAGYKMTITGKGGKAVWSGATSDHSGRFGRSYRADTYYDALSNALAGATKKLMIEDQTFRDAIRGG